MSFTTFFFFQSLIFNGKLPFFVLMGSSANHIKYARYEEAEFPAATQGNYPIIDNRAPYTNNLSAGNISSSCQSRYFTESEI